jgi:hypothetical protein
MHRSIIFESLALQLLGLAALALCEGTYSRYDFVCSNWWFDPRHGYTGDGNYICDGIVESSAVELCTCFHQMPCYYSVQWYDPAIGECSWTRELLDWFIELLKTRNTTLSGGGSSQESTTQPTFDATQEDEFCANLPDGNYVCNESSDATELCSCAEGRLCPLTARHQVRTWFDPSVGNCSYSRELLQWLIDRVNDTRPTALLPKNQPSTSRQINVPAETVTSMSSFQTVETTKTKNSQSTETDQSTLSIESSATTITSTSVQSTTASIQSTETPETTSGLPDMRSRKLQRKCLSDDVVDAAKALDDKLFYESDLDFKLTDSMKQQKVNVCLMKRYKKLRTLLKINTKLTIHMADLPTLHLKFSASPQVTAYIQAYFRLVGRRTNDNAAQYWDDDEYMFTLEGDNSFVTE